MIRSDFLHSRELRQALFLRGLLATFSAPGRNPVVAFGAWLIARRLTQGRAN